jgi:hypothetical protein
MLRRFHKHPATHGKTKFLFFSTTVKNKFGCQNPELNKAANVTKIFGVAARNRSFAILVAVSRGTLINQN